MLKAHTTQTTFDTLTEILRKEKRVIFSRFGDGDIFIMDGRDQKNHYCSPALSREMTDAFTINNSAYLRALAVNYPREKYMSRGCFAPFSCNDYLAGVIEKLLASDMPHYFENAITFHYMAAFAPRKMNAFLDEFVRGKRILYIGGIGESSVVKVLGKTVVHVKTPMRDAYHHIDTWWPEVLSKLSQTDVVIPSAGMASRIINKRLWNMDIPVVSIDIGSLFDAIDNRGTRTWIRLVGHRMQQIVLPEYRKKTVANTLRDLMFDIRYCVRSTYR